MSHRSAVDRRALELHLVAEIPLADAIAIAKREERDGELELADDGEEDLPEGLELEEEDE